MKALKVFDGVDPATYTAESFAKELRRHGRQDTRSTYSVIAIENELTRVSAWFSRGGSFYDLDGNILSVDGSMISDSTLRTQSHMKGNCDPKTCSLFSADQRRKIDSVQSHNLTHNSSADTSQLN